MHGVGRKAGEVPDLHPELRAYVDTGLSSGDLSEAEASYRAGSIDAYRWFPAGRLTGGKVQLKQCGGNHAGEKALRDLFVRLAQHAGVGHVHGRAFYGLRRMETDVAAAVEPDPEVLNGISGHLHTETQGRVYHDPKRKRERTGARAAVSRWNLRKAIAETGGEAA